MKSFNSVTLLYPETYALGGLAFKKGVERTDISDSLAKYLAGSPHFSVKLASRPAATAEVETEVVEAAEGEPVDAAAEGKTKLVLGAGKVVVKAKEEKKVDASTEGSVGV